MILCGVTIAPSKETPGPEAPWKFADAVEAANLARKRAWSLALQMKTDASVGGEPSGKIARLQGRQGRQKGDSNERNDKKIHKPQTLL